MPIPNYRVTLSFDGERQVFVARAPELPHCTAEGATRAEATAKLEQEIEAQIQNMLAQGQHAPAPVDEAPLDGNLHVQVSAGLHRDLLWQARQEGVELGALLAEMIAAGLEARRTTRTQQRAPQQHRAAADPDSIGNSVGASDRNGPDRNGRGGRGGYGGRYNPNLMDDRANFIEYVRSLEHSGGVAGPGGPRGGGPGGGGGGDAGRRRRRGGGGGGGGGFNGGGGGRGPGGAQNAGGGGGGGNRY